MKNLKKTILCLALAGGTLRATPPPTSCQLVTDGGFESINVPCSTLVCTTLPNFGASNWFYPNGNAGSPDIYASCAPLPTNPGPNVYNSVNSTNNSLTMGICNTSPHTGSGYGGIYVYSNHDGSFTSSNIDYREYLCQPLVYALVPGRTYNFQMYVRLACRSKFAVKDFQMFFSNGKPTQNGSPTPANGFSTAGTWVSFTNTSPVTSTTGWTLLSGTFVAPANTNYNWVSIGNSLTDASTTFTDLDPSNNWTYDISPGTMMKRSYYFIDDVSITEAPISVSFNASQACNNSYQVNFTGIYPGPQAPTSISWDFGDYTTSSVINPSHTYAQFGNYTVKLTLTFPCQTQVYTQVIHVANDVVTGSPMSLCNPSTTNGVYSIPTLMPNAPGNYYTWSIYASVNNNGFSVSYTNVNPDGSSISINWAPVLSQLATLQQQAMNNHDATTNNNTPIVQICVHDNICTTQRCITLSGCCGVPPGPSDGNQYYFLKDATLVPSGTPGVPDLGTYANLSVVTGYVGVGSPFNANIAVEGVLTVSADLTLSGFWNFSEGSELDINPNYNVNIYNADMRGCVYMWKGITNMGKLNVNESQIQDAVTAIYNNGTASSQLQIYNTLFNRNKTGVSLMQMPATTTNFNINGSIFTSRNCGQPQDATWNAVESALIGGLSQNMGPNIENSYASAFTKGSPLLGIPVNLSLSETGVLVTNIPSVNTFVMQPSGSSNINYFDNLGICGVSINNSNAKIDNNIFKNMAPTITSNGTGISITNGSNKSTVTIGLANGNTFSKLNNGVVATNEGALVVNKGAFSNIYNRGISFSNWNATSTGAHQVMLHYNTFNNCYTDMYAYNNYKINAYINNNVSHGNQYNVNTSPTNVYINELSKPQTALYYIYSNEFDDYINGIHCLNVFDANITHNTIMLGKLNPSNPNGNAAIWLENCDNATVMENLLSFDPAISLNMNDVNTAGILSNICHNNLYQCNTIKHTGVSMKFNGACPSRIFSNSLNYNTGTPCYYGIYVDNSGYTGPIAGNVGTSQASALNNFGTYSLADTYVHSGSGAAVHYPGAATYPYYPQVNHAYSTYSPFGTWQNNLQINVTCGSNVGSPSPSNLPLGPGVKDFYSSGLTLGANTDLTYAIAKLSTFALLKSFSPDSLPPDAGDFLANNAGSNSDLFYQVNQQAYAAIDANDPTQFSTPQRNNDAIITNNIVESNQVAFNDIFYRYLQDQTQITAVDVDNLKNLAMLCPFTNGSAVYQSRALLKNYDPTDRISDCEKTPMDTTYSGGGSRLMQPAGTKDNPTLATLTKVYPNPNSGSLWASTEAEGASIVVYNLLGEVLISQPVSHLTEINTQKLAAGTYIYKIIVNEQVLKTDKLIMTK